MKIFFFLLLVTITFLEALLAGSLRPYYEVENPKNGRKFYLLGTSHQAPLSSIPQAVVNHIKARYAVATEKNNPSSTSSPRALSHSNVNEFRRNGFIREAQDQNDYLGKMTPAQKHRFLTAVGHIYPNLAHNRDPKLKLSDLNSLGLQSLYSKCTSFHHGMDGEISRIFHKRFYPAAYALDKNKCIDICEQGRKQTREGFMKNPSHYYREFLRHLELGIPYDFNALRSFHEGGYNNPYAKDRNLSWLPTILAYNQQHSVDLFVFGSGHLPGEYGIVNLLLEKGFRVKKANAQCQFGACLEDISYQRKNRGKFIANERIRAASIVTLARQQAKQLVNDEDQRAKMQIKGIIDQFNQSKTKAVSLVRNVNQKLTQDIRAEKIKLKNLIILTHKKFVKKIQALRKRINQSKKNQKILKISKNQLTQTNQTKAKIIKKLQENSKKRQNSFITKHKEKIKWARNKHGLMLQQATKQYKTCLEQAKKYAQTQKIKIHGSANNMIITAKNHADTIVRNAQKKYYR